MIIILFIYALSTFFQTKFKVAIRVSIFFPLRQSFLHFSLVPQSCPTICDPMNCSPPGLPVHHQLPEFTQTQVHRVSDAIQPSHPLASPSPPAFNLSQHQGLFQWVCSSHQVVQVFHSSWKPVHTQAFPWGSACPRNQSGTWRASATLWLHPVKQPWNLFSRSLSIQKVCGGWVAESCPTLYGLPFPSPGEISDPGIEPGSPA